MIHGERGKLTQYTSVVVGCDAGIQASGSQLSARKHSESVAMHGFKFRVSIPRAITELQSSQRHREARKQRRRSASAAQSHPWLYI
jgi:hypothetical protein